MSIRTSPWRLLTTIFLLLALALPIGHAAPADAKAPPKAKALSFAGTVYYVDSAAGSDSGNGLSPATAWKTLTKVNAKTFDPGDAILFKAGGVWTGTLWPKGSGDAANPITIGKYGSGRAPLINGAGAANAVYLYNQQYWDIGDLEVTNDSATASNRRGVYVVGEDAGTLHAIHLRNLYVHRVKGDNTKDAGGSAGILVEVKGTTTETSFDDVVIENNRVSSVDRTGIATFSSWRYSAGIGYSGPAWVPLTHVVIRNNFVSDTGGDGITPHVTDGALIEYNVVDGFNVRSGTFNAGIWTWASDHAVMQHNEVYNGNTPMDGMAFDIDHGQTGTVVQYNYSHDNDGGFVLVCKDPAAGFVRDSVIRYNVSQNDNTQIFGFCADSENTKIYNNTVFVHPDTAPYLIAVGSSGASAYWTNNIFYNLGEVSYLMNGSTNTFEHNLFYGYHPSNEPADANKITADPKFVSPGSGRDGMDTLDGYKLKTGSPALGAGKLVAGNGGADYWGNAVSSSAAPNIGAYNGAGVTPPNLTVNPGFETGSLSGWTTVSAGSSPASVASGDVRAGAYAAKIYPGAYLEQTVTVQPNTTYTLKGWAKPTGTGLFPGQVWIGLQDAANPSLNGYYEIGIAVWKPAITTFTTGPSTTSVKVYVNYVSGADYALIDDIELTKN
ncbi:right-handed parallel beta-helix repeat-containing protein [Cohnella sp. GbtcB17]|uniref:right-handed parallel beta-helix repeat-containing protein n=1 Tax=Cohnella sp. GbtcB17 TaxID=2824762 RepID=UPI001C310B64|nr:right-handed parallel beta-helix repeat-containing protein [Cohnella sp. GbtcB17]